MAGRGGFNHNLQSLRIVEVLENRYPTFPGLNLTWEVREGIAKHSGPPPTNPPPEIAEYDPDVPPPVEAQLIDLVDEIAYNHHDIDDGLESGLLRLDDLTAAVPLFGETYAAAAREHPARDQWMWIKVALRGVIDALVTDLVDHVRERVGELSIDSVEAVRRSKSWVVALSPEMAVRNRQLKEYLGEKLYRHPRIGKTRRFFERVLRELFLAYTSGEGELPASFSSRREGDDRYRVACDYIAGMTDRFALQEHRRWCGGPGPEVIPAATRGGD